MNSTKQILTARKKVRKRIAKAIGTDPSSLTWYHGELFFLQGAQRIRISGKVPTLHNPNPSARKRKSRRCDKHTIPTHHSKWS